MKRDMDLCRGILIALEDDALGADPNNITVEGFDDKQQVAYHCYLLIGAGLIRGEVIENGGYGTPPNALPYGLTWAGHEFLESARPPNRWNEAKSIMSKIGGASLQVWIRVLTAKAEEAVVNLLS